ncbi:MAG TPA: hypothetical protein VEW28_01860 [Candidatus Kapabacteria bacterium]|nr:hypothetical protein [Candidatus Kapabacteria bacterium]
MNFPRSLTNEELNILSWLLPEHSSVYGSLLWNIRSRIVLGEGRWGTGDLVMGSSDMQIDVTLPMTPAIAYGECFVGDETLSVSAHEKNIDDQIEVQFSGVFPISENIDTASGWTYSYWKPGMPCPATGEPVREAALYEASGAIKYTLAISSAKKTIWLHHHASAYNQFIGITAFADELFRTHHIRDADAVMHPASVFTRLSEFTDADLRRALIEYNTFGIRKFDVEGIAREEKVEKKSLLAKLLKK